MTPAPLSLVGIGLRSAHYAPLRAALERGDVAIDFVELHSENFFGQGGQPHAYLDWFSQRTQISLHGVGLSLASADALSATHLDRLRRLEARVKPRFVSDHLAWVGAGGRYLNDLLPAALTPTALDHVCTRVDAVQSALGRQFLVENITQYVPYAEGAMPEAEFLNTLCERTGCGLLLDLNNIHVNECNLGASAHHYLAEIDPQYVYEMHLGGFEWQGAMAVDTHGAPVPEAVWLLLAHAAGRFSHAAVLIERDNNLPPLADLLAEAEHARQILTAPLADRHHALAPATTNSKRSGRAKAPPLAPDFVAYQHSLARAIVDEAEPLPAALAAGVAIYRNSVHHTQTGALAAIYPAVRGAMGAAAFTKAANLYLKAHPSASGDLHDLGAHFSHVVGQPKYARRWHFLSDLAALEWLVHRAFHAPDAAALPPQAFAAALAAAGDQAGSLTMTFVPAFALLESQHTLLPHWAAHAGTPSRDAPKGRRPPGGAMVARNVETGVVVEALALGDFGFCEALYRGAPLESALNAALAADADFDLQALLQRLAHAGALQSVSVVDATFASGLLTAA